MLKFSLFLSHSLTQYVYHNSWLNWLGLLYTHRFSIRVMKFIEEIMLNKLCILSLTLLFFFVPFLIAHSSTTYSQCSNNNRLVQFHTVRCILNPEENNFSQEIYVFMGTNEKVIKLLKILDMSRKHLAAGLIYSKVTF